MLMIARQKEFAQSPPHSVTLHSAGLRGFAKRYVQLPLTMKGLHMNRIVCRTLLFILTAPIPTQSLYPQWIGLSSGLPDSSTVRAIVISGSKIFAGTSRAGVYLSTDAGLTWTSRSAGLSGNSLRVVSLFVDGPSLFMGTMTDGPFRSSDDGISWIRIDSGMTISGTRRGGAFYFHKSGDELYMAAESGIYVSTNNGFSWVKSTTRGAWSLVSDSSHLFEGTPNSGVYRYPLTGGTWTSVNTGLPPNAEIDAMLIYRDKLIVSVWRYSIFYSTNSGDTWTKLLPGLPVSGSITIVCFLSDGRRIYAGTSEWYQYSGIFQSEDTARTWSLVNTGLPSNISIGTLALDSDFLYAGSNKLGTIWRRARSDFATSFSISGYVRTSGGIGIFGVVMSGLPGDPSTDIGGYYAGQVNDGWSGTVTPRKTGYTFSPSSTVYNSITTNQSTDYTAALQTFAISGYVRTSGGAGISGVIMSGLPGNPSTDSSGYYTGTVNYGWWGGVMPQKTGYTFNPSSTGYNNVTTNQSTDYTATLQTFSISGYVRTAGGAGIGAVIMSGLPGNPGTDSTGHYRGTVNHGWSGTLTPTKTGYTLNPSSTLYNNVTTNQFTDYTATLQTFSIYGYVRTSGGAGIGGVVMSGPPANPITDSSGYYRGTVNHGWSGTVMPTKAGYTFTPSSVTYDNVTTNQSTDYIATLQTFSISGYVRTSGGVGIGGVVISGLPGNPGTDSSGYYRGTVNHGWSGTVTPTKTGYTFNPSSIVYDIVTANRYSEYTATAPTAVEQISQMVPDYYLLSQNYPNPFNPTTTIRFEIPEAEHVSLKIYDVLGKEAAALLGEYLDPGIYCVQWDAGHFVSGTYFYCLRAGSVVQVKKLTLLR
ncbi:MAG TPA: hypothetical protein DEP53_10310 [Bacteroidetes bacterium]|nr:hypothetical protein [Bacteroidota bacterium]